MSEEEQTDELPVKDRALAAAKVAARRAAAFVLYEEQCSMMDVEPKPWEGEGALSGKAQKKWLAQADEILTEAAPAPRPAPARRDPSEQHEPDQPAGSNSDAVSAYAGNVKVEDREADDLHMVDDGDGGKVWQPPFTHALIKVTRGNLTLPLKIPADLLSPDVTAGAGMVISNLRDGFLRAQGQGSPSMPVNPAGQYALKLADGTVLTQASRLRASDFNVTLEEDPSLPGALAELVDVGGQARTQPVQGPAALGNPVVIQSGAVIGKPVHGGGGQPQTAGQARVAPQTGPGGGDQGQARV